ncbi:hypothetical protein FRC00_010664, partial [Tulasnella sp. 408]
MDARPTSEAQPDTRQAAYVHRPPVSSPAASREPHIHFASTNRPTEPPPPSAQEQDDDSLASPPPTLTTTSTSASSSLPVTPATPYTGRFSTGRSYQPSLPGHREEDEPRSAGLFSSFQFAFRPPSQPVSEPPSSLGRAGSTTSASSSPSSSGTGLGTHWIPLSTPSSQSYDESKTAGCSVPSTPGSSFKVPKGFTPSVSGLEKTVFDPARGVDVQETVKPVEESNDGEVEDSPFPEVRASVSNVDDPDMP